MADPYIIFPNFFPRDDALFVLKVFLKENSNYFSLSHAVDRDQQKLY